MPGPKYEAGTIRYLNFIGSDGKTYTKKQKYYHLTLEIPNDGTWSGFASIYKQGWITGSAQIPPYHNYDKDLKKFNVTSFPDSSIKLINSGFLNYVNERALSGEYYILTDDIIQDNQLYNDSYQNEDYGDYIDSLPYGSQFNFIKRVDYAVGILKVYGWAEFSKNQDEQEKQAPGALDKDWTLEEVKDKQDDIQTWVNNNLLPPIFGKTNCVYFPSNLGDTKSDKPNDLNPIIKSYPIKGNISKVTGDNYEYYGYDYPISDKFQLIKCKLDETFTITCNFPFIRTTERFDLIQDTYTYEEGVQNAPSNKQYFTAQSYKVNQIVKIRFIDGQTGKFNQYIMQGIITASNVPTEVFTDFAQTVKKYTVTFKFINDLNLTENQYFNAKVVIFNQPETNYIQNETYCIQRYYKKDLGIGPRLGGSVIIANKGDFETTEPSQNYYTLFTALKDEEKLNKPYLNVNMLSNYYLNKFDSGLENYDIIHEFSKQDLGGQFISIGQAILLDKPDKQYIESYRCYLIKNLDEHTYEQYKTLSYGYSAGLVAFRQANDNADLTFSSYD